MKFTNNLLEDEVALLGHSELTDRLLFRIAWNRKMATQFHKQLKETGWSAGRAPTDEEMPAIQEWVEKLYSSPEHAESEKRRAECQERGGHAWGPVQLDAREPFVRCPHCLSSMPAHQLPLERPCLIGLWTEHEHPEGSAPVDSFPTSTEVSGLTPGQVLVSCAEDGRSCYVLRGVYPTWNEAQAVLDRLHGVEWDAWLAEWKAGIQQALQATEKKR